MTGVQTCALPICSPHGVPQLRDYIRARQGRADVLFLGIFTREGGAHVGNVKYEPVDDAKGYAVMGILVGEAEWRGRGVAAEVIEASARWLGAHRNVREIVLGVEKDHAAAIRAYEKLGFRVEPTDRIPPKDGAIAMVWRPGATDRKSTRLNSSHMSESRMPSSA